MQSVFRKRHRCDSRFRIGSSASLGQFLAGRHVQHELNSKATVPEPAAVALQLFMEKDRPILEDWVRRIGSDRYMARYVPEPDKCLLWCIVQVNGVDVGTVWLERLPEEGAANLGVLLGDPSLFGQGVGRKAVKLAIARACGLELLQVVRLNVRETNLRAIACYAGCGFCVVKSFVRTASGKLYRVLSMEKWVDRPGSSQQ